MKLPELKERLDYHKIPGDWYCLGEEAQYADCLLYEDGRWIIFTLNRGKRRILFESPSEDEACEKLLELEMKTLEHKKKIFEKRQKQERKEAL